MCMEDVIYLVSVDPWFLMLKKVYITKINALLQNDTTKSTSWSPWTLVYTEDCAPFIFDHPNP